MELVVLYLTDAGKDIASKLTEGLADIQGVIVEPIGPQDWHKYQANSLREVVQRVFYSRRPLIFVMATGIVVRMVGPLARGKDVDPPVLTVDDGGNFVISLLSGHLGGANKLTELVAVALKATPVITTASDVHGYIAFDQLAQTKGWHLQPLKAIKVANGALVQGKPIKVLLDREIDLTGLRDIAIECNWPDTVEIESVPQPGNQEGAYEVQVIISHKRLITDLERLQLIPKVLTLGIGCRAGTSAQAIEAAVEQVFSEFNLSIHAIKRVASITAKAEEPGLLAWAKQYGHQPIFFSAEAIQAELDKKKSYSYSKFVHEQMGVGGVCEPVAVMAEPGAQLLVPKQKLGGITIAVAMVRSL